MHARVPASSANLGPGFDALGMALTLYTEVGAGDPPSDLDGAARPDDHHPAVVAFRRAGGEGPVWVRCPIPSGRGLGFSGAVRIGGIVAAHAQRQGADVGDLIAARPEILRLATELEGHADNVAASMVGGIVVTADDRALQVPTTLDPAIVVWVPSFTTSTAESRGKLGMPVAFEDAVFNVGRVALLVAALATGDTDALRAATQDRLHQDVRFASAEPSRAALDVALATGAWCGWLSGSGPTVAAMCAAADAPDLAAALPRDGGHTKILSIDRQGASIVP